MIHIPGDNSDDSSFFPLGEVGESIGGTNQDDAPVFVDDTMADWGGKQIDDNHKNRRIGTSVKNRTLQIAFLIMVLGLIAVAARAAHIQVIEGRYYAELAEGNRSRIEWVPTERGVMFDRNGNPVVGNAPRFTVTVTPADLPRDPAERRLAIGRISEMLSMNPRDIEDHLATYSQTSTVAVPVAENVSHEQAVLTDIASIRWPAIQLVKGIRREYYLTETSRSMSHILGFEGSVSEEDLENSDYLPTDLIGRTGLERSYESVLRGTHGRRRIEVDALGSRKTVIAEESGVPGKNLILCIDSELQEKAEEVLLGALEKLDKNRGSVVIMDPNTGEVLAMVSLPSFDNNLFARGISTEEYQAMAEDENNPLFPRAIGASLPSGSTFKLVVAAAALSEGIVTPRTTFLSSGGIAVGRWFFPDWKAGGHGLTNLYKAISESVNTYFYIIGGGYEEHDGLGMTKIIEYARRFGLGATNGIDLPGEGGGFLPSKEWKLETKGERWYDGDTYHLAIGQGDILVTPLQIATMTAAFANGGKLIQPHVVNAVITQNGERIDMPVNVINDSVVDSEYIHHVRQGMRDSVLYGSSRSLSLLPVSAAGKTGTAQWSSTKDTHAWFTSFAPFEEPEIVVTVSIEEGGEGSVAAAPVARDIMAWYFGEDEGSEQP